MASDSSLDPGPFADLAELDLVVPDEIRQGHGGVGRVDREDLVAPVGDLVDLDRPLLSGQEIDDLLFYHVSHDGFHVNFLAILLLTTE